MRRSSGVERTSGGTEINAMVSAAMNAAGLDENKKPEKSSTFKLLLVGGGLTLVAIAGAKLGWKVLKPF